MAFCFIRVMSLFDMQRKVLFSVKGESEYETFRPVANSDLLEVGRPEAGDVDQARRERSFVRLERGGSALYGTFTLRGIGL